MDITPSQEMGDPNAPGSAAPAPTLTSRGKSPATDFPNGRLLQIPPELLYKVLLQLGPLDLVAISLTCRDLHAIATEDYIWKPIVQEQVPGVVVSSPYPCPSFYHLYVSHHLRWFVPRNKIWFCDTGFTGQLAVARYDPRTGNIEAYQLLAINAEKGLSEFWTIGDDSVSIAYRFKPSVRLHMDRPIVRLVADGYGYGHEEQEAGPFIRINLRDDEESDEHAGHPRRFRLVTSMVAPDTRWNRTFIFAANDTFTPVPQNAARHMGLLETVWPPPTIPAQHRINIIDWQFPRSRSQISEQAFRIGTRLAPSDGAPDCWATLDPVLYTPTPQYPFRGIFVGDYGPHNCEFILFHQPEDPHFDPDNLVKWDDESDEQYAKRKVFHGRLEAIKLTGDPNVPRGMHTFIVKDLSDYGTTDTVPASPYGPTGPTCPTTVVESMGHIALDGFRNDTYIDSQLVVLSFDRMAQHWLDSHHISFFERVDIDAFTGI